MQTRRSIFRKQIRIYYLVVFLPVMILSVILYRFAVKNNIDTIAEESYSTLMTASESVTAKAASIESIVESVAYNNQIIDLVENDLWSDYLRTSRQQEVVSWIVNAETCMSSTGGKIVLFVNSEHVPETYWKVLHISSVEEEDDYQAFSNLNRNTAWVGPAMIYPPKTVLNSKDNASMFCFYRRINVGISGFAGVVKAGIPIDKLFEAVIYEDSADSASVLLDSRVIFGREVDRDDLFKSDNSREIFQGRLYLSVFNERTGVRIMISRSVRDCYIRALVIILPTALSLLLFGAVIGRLFRNYALRINKEISATMSLAAEVSAGKTDLSLKTEGEDDISQLIKAFNTVLDEYALQTQEKLRIEKAEKNAMQLALQYRMNPHFLFNTLNWLRISVDMQPDREMIMESIVILSHLLRYNLQGDEMALLDEEKSMIEEYMRLMNYRKRESINLCIDTSGVPGTMKIMRFMLQPLCENAIQHGLIPGHSLDISIVISRVSDQCRIEVSNNGREIEQTKLDELRNQIKSNQKENGIGLSTIAARLRLLYDGNSEMQIRSENGETKIVIVFPAEIGGVKNASVNC